MKQLLLALALTSSAFAQEAAFPSKNITLIVPFAAGGASDIVARIISEDLSRALGQSLIIENVAGAGGSAGLSRLVKAAPDGYTIAIGNTGTNAASYTLYPDLKYTPADFAPIGLIAYTSAVIALKKDTPHKDMASFLDYARKNPGQINLGHAGIGSSNYLICLSFLKATNVDVKLIGYRGAGPAKNDILGGHIDGVCDNAASIGGAIVDNKAFGLVVSGDRPLKSMPHVPTAVKAGIPAFQANGWNALYAPKDTPAPILARLNAALVKILGDEKLIARLEGVDSSVPLNNELTPAFLQNLTLQEVEKYKLLLKDAGR
jgi:tripartite-type tricarboxylate transporter receptor subunit TctC